MEQVLYNKIGTGYNQTRKADPAILQQILQLLSLKEGSEVLDIGCGSGNYTIALAAKGLAMQGIDPSDIMLQTARERNAEIPWIQGSAEHLPLEAGIFQGIVGILTLHHWNDLEQAFRELHRVLQPEGHIILFTATPEQMEGYWLNHYFPQMMQQSRLQMPSYERIEQATTRAGFLMLDPLPFSVSNALQDHFLYTGKYRPELYFEEVIRKGISSFAALSAAEEVQHGLNRLRTDIQTGSFTTIQQQYENEGGDYLFIKAKRL